MGCLVLLALLILPFAEFNLLARSVASFGFLNTVFLLFLSGMFGIYCVKLQGAITWQKMHQNLSQGIAPTNDMINGLFVFVAGVLFIFPGFVSDMLGFLLVFPVTRWLLKLLLFRQAVFSRQPRHDAARRPPKAGKTPPKARGIDRDDAQDAEIVDE